MQDDVLSIDISLALKWCELPATSSTSALRQHNLLTFSLLDALHEQPAVAHDAHHASPELQRIENKLNLLIELVSQLAGRSTSHWHPIPVRLSCRGIEWLSDTPIDKIQLLLELYLDGDMRHALKIIAEVVSVTEQKGRYLIGANFKSLDEIEENQLEKWIFSHHRRRVAEVRKRNSPV